MKTLTRSHVLIVPLVVLLLVLLEEMVEYQLRAKVADPYLRTIIIMVLYSAGFGWIATQLGPWLKTGLLRARSGHNKRGGRIGVGLFFLLAYGLLFVAFLIVEMSGPAALMPESWR